MIVNKKSLFTFINCFICLVLIGCASSGRGGNSGNMQSFAFNDVEAEWIRNGEPFEFEGELWYPSDGIESLTDAEVIPVHKHKEVDIFIDKIDVRPYDRLYTKFGVNKFRYFKRR